MFTTRLGGVSEGPFSSLNLGRKTGDDVERVDENRRRACAEIGADADRLALNYQLHSTLVHRARAGSRGERGDGLWTDEPDLPMLAMSADCLPVALARTNGGAPAVAVVHVGWRGLLDGILESAVDALGGGGLAAAIGPGIGPCCYEVRDDVADPFRARFGRGIVQRREARSVALRPRPRCATQACRASTASTSARPAARSSSSPTGATASRAESRECSRVSPDEIRERYERIKSEVGPSVTVVAATKYVSVDELDALAAAGVEVVGENRAQDLEAKHARYGDRFRWHFIGHLQSRKAKTVSELCELCHSLGVRVGGEAARRSPRSSR